MAVSVPGCSQAETPRDDAGRDDPPGSPGPSPSPSLLEHFQNVVTGEEGGRSFELAPCGCDCWYCPGCCKRKGYNLRADLVPVLQTFTGLMMLTLTIDPELFGSPLEAYFHVRSRRGISRLMRELDRAGHLHTRRYFYVVEFQRETEQAHFHVLCDATRIPKPAIDAAWSRLRPETAPPPAPNRPAFGMTRFSMPRFEGGAAHAARYATKYLVKVPEHGFPEWVLTQGNEYRVPRYGSSRGLWGRERVEPTPSGQTRQRSELTYRDRIEGCGSSVNVFETDVQTDPATGELIAFKRWCGRIDLTQDELADLADTDRPGRPRLCLIAPNKTGLIQATIEAAGRPVRVISGLAEVAR